MRVIDTLSTAMDEHSSRDVAGLVGRLMRPASDCAGGVPWRSVFDQAAAPLALLDLDGDVRYVNPAFCRLLGQRRTELLGRSAQDITYGGDPALRAGVVRQLLAGQSYGPVRTRYRRAGGGAVPALMSITLLRDDDGRPSHVLVQAQDVSDRPELEPRWHASFASAPVAMALLDLRGRWTMANDALAELLGYPATDLVALPVGELTYPDGGEADRALAELVEGAVDSVSIERRYRHRNGQPVWLLTRVSAVHDASGRPEYLVGQYEAIGDGRMSAAHLKHLAMHDPLTGLANRALLADRLERELAELRRSGGVLAVLVADLDGLKQVNDQHGHATGDQLLITTATLLLNAVRPRDTVARMGGDEFVVVGRVHDRQAAESFRARVADQLAAAEVTAIDGAFRLTASVGLAVTDDPDAEPKSVLHQADRDMYARKHRRRSTRYEH